MNIFDLKERKTEPRLICIGKLQINVKTSVSQTQKIIIVDKIKQFYFTDNGVSSEEINITCKDLKSSIFIYSILNSYTDLDLGESNNYIEIADIATNSGLLIQVLEKIPQSELKMLEDMINDSIAEEYRKIQENLSIEKQLERFLTMALQKIPSEKSLMGMIKKIKKEFNGFDPKKLSFLNNTLQSFGEKGIPDLEKVTEMGENILKDMKVKNK